MPIYKNENIYNIIYSKFKQIKQNQNKYFSKSNKIYINLLNILK